MLKKSLLIIGLTVSIANAGVWKYYQFKPNEHFVYSLKYKTEDTLQTGKYDLKILPAEGKAVKVEVKGSLGGFSGEYSFTLQDPSQLSGALVGQFMMNPWLAPFAMVFFSPVAAMYFGQFALQGLEIGNKWKFKNDKGEVWEAKIDKTCKYAGVKGKHLIVRFNGKTMYEMCINEDIGLPLYAKVQDEDGTLYEVKLEKYSSK